MDRMGTDGGYATRLEGVIVNLAGETARGGKGVTCSTLGDDNG